MSVLADISVKSAQEVFISFKEMYSLDQSVLSDI